ncbi:MAG TPA: HD domain-containing protein [Blastocatellia bacterium]|nr:HD domain-containing protein [Blastocatellia bacterium]
MMISSAVIKLCEAVNQAGGRALLVGGWVRDFARGVDNVDYDIEVYGLEAPALRSLIEAHGKVDAVGEAFTVYKVRLRDRERRKSLVVDVSLPRRESKTGRGHRGFVIEGDPWMSIEEAARRRDFTVNAMMYDPLAGDILDPYGGREDISRGIIRVVDPKTFIEDSLRVLRAMQFAARFEYSIDPATIELCRSIDLSDLPAERIWGEVEKWLLQSRRPSLGLWAARELGVTEKLWPEIHALIHCPQDPIAHPEGDVFIHTGMVLDEARKLIENLPRPKQIAVMLAALCHDLAKPYTTRIESGRIKAREHESMGVAITERFLDRLKLFTFDNYDARRQTLALVESHAVPHQWFKTPEAITDGMFRRLALKTELDLLYRVARADCLGRKGDFKPDAEEWFIARARSLGVEERPPKPLLMGRHVLDLGLQPGPQVGEVTRAVYELQLDGEITTLDEAIEAARKIIEK